MDNVQYNAVGSRGFNARYRGGHYTISLPERVNSDYPQSPPYLYAFDCATLEPLQAHASCSVPEHERGRDTATNV
jgi:hypothetical protein